MWREGGREDRFLVCSTCQMTRCAEWSACAGAWGEPITGLWWDGDEALVWGTETVHATELVFFSILFTLFARHRPFKSCVEHLRRFLIQASVPFYFCRLCLLAYVYETVPVVLSFFTDRLVTNVTYFSSIRYLFSQANSTCRITGQRSIIARMPGFRYFRDSC